jgi:cytosine/adenosine deaminase-related metal-dependent hydrolase
VLSLDPAVGDFEQADVLVEGGKISAVRPNVSAPNAEVIDASKAIVMPGFVDTHRHMWQGYLRHVLPDGSLADYLNLVQRKFGATMTPDDVYAADLLSALGAIDSGVTTVLDWSHIHNTPEHSDAVIKALSDSGVRAVFAYGNPQNETGRFWEMQGHKFPGDIARLRKQYFSSEDQLLTLYMAAPGGAPEIILGAFRAGREVGARISIHVGVGEFGRGGLLEKLNAQQALKSDTTYIHCCTLNDTEWKLIKDTGGTISIAGYVEMLMGHGNPPVQKALDNGISSPRCAPSSRCRRTKYGQGGSPATRTRRRFSRCATCSNSPPSKVRARTDWSARSARSRPARMPTSFCFAPTFSTSCRSTMRSERW